MINSALATIVARNRMMPRKRSQRFSSSQRVSPKTCVLGSTKASHQNLICERAAEWAEPAEFWPCGVRDEFVTYLVQSSSFQSQSQSQSIPNLELIQ